MPMIALLTALLLEAAPPRAEQPRPTPPSDLTVDESFDPPISAPAYPSGKGPLILVDEGHRNVVSLKSYFAPVARFLAKDGYAVKPLSQPLSQSSLKSARIVIIINAQAPQGAPEDGSAFAAEEIKALDQWVRRGGGLLLIADRAPFGGPASALGKRLGVTFDNNTILRRGADGKPDGVLSLDVKQVGDPSHPILKGISRLVYVVGESLWGPGAILRAPSDAYIGATINSTEGQPAGGKPLALAFSRGSGRVVAIGDAGIFSAFGSVAGPAHRGISEGENSQFLRNAVRWLAR